jgi:hypothetical protein
MTTASPGPGWWLASDGNWYPQRWEYKCTSAWNQPSPKDATNAIEQFVDEMGQEGWEMVNFTVYSMGTEGSAMYQNVTTWGIACYWKRPLAP